MQHRHLNHQNFTLAAIDDVIGRGQRQDWSGLRHAVLDSPLHEKSNPRMCREAHRIE